MKTEATLMHSSLRRTAVWLAVVLTLTACGTATSPSASPPSASASGNALPRPSNYQAGQTEGTVVVVDGGGTYHDSLVLSTYDPFEELTDIKLTFTNYDYSIGAIQAQVEGAKEWDVVSLGNPVSDELAAKLFMPLDYSVVKADGIPDSSKEKYRVVYVYFAHVLAYRTDKYTTAPTSSSAFFDLDAFPGKRAANNYPVGTLEFALLADGVAPEDLYPLDVERALAKLKSLNDQEEIVWYDSGAQQVELITNELADMAIAWNGRMLGANAEGIPVDYIVDGAVNQSTSWVVLKTAPHPKAAMEFINFATTAEINAADSLAFLGNSPANANSYSFIGDELASKLPTNPALADRIGGYVDDAWWADNFDDVYARWQDWFTSL